MEENLKLAFDRFIQLSIEATRDTGYVPFIKEGFRTSSRQADLYSQGRTKRGNIITYARPGQSIHESGRAVDVWFRDRSGNEITPDEAEAMGLYDKISPLGKRLGLNWGGSWKMVDKPHFEVEKGSTQKFKSNINKEYQLALNPPQRKPVLEKRKVEIAKATMPKPKPVPTPTIRRMPQPQQTAQAPQQQREPFKLVPQAHAQTPMQQNIPTPAPTPMQPNYAQSTYPAPVPTPTPSGPMSVARGGQSGFAQSNQPQRVPTPSVARSYTVRSGQTLWGIAQQQLGSGSRWRELGFGGDPRKLPVGQVLKY